LAGRKRHRTTIGWPAITVGLVLAASLLFVAHLLDFGAVLERWTQLYQERGGDVSVASRIAARDASWVMWKQVGLRGTGAGSFRYLFPLFAQRYPAIFQGGAWYWEHAHCDLLEVPIELGLAGLAILLFILFLPLRVILCAR